MQPTTGEFKKQLEAVSSWLKEEEQQQEMSATEGDWEVWELFTLWAEDI